MKLNLKLPEGELHFELEPLSDKKFQAVCALVGTALYTALTWIIVSMGSVPVVFGFFTLSFLAALFKVLAGLAG